MPKKEAPINTLANYLPEGTYEPVLDFLRQHKVHLTVARERRSILGDYRHRTPGENHRISVNGNLNTYSFLITLLHELAHLLTFEQFGNKVSAHGKEWKNIFGKMLELFIQKNVFPDDIRRALADSLHDPAASSCADEQLLRVLKRYDANAHHLVFVESMPPGALFKTADGKVFRKGEKLRKRFRCEEVRTMKQYLFSPVYEAEVVSS